MADGRLRVSAVFRESVLAARVKAGGARLYWIGPRSRLVLPLCLTAALAAGCEDDARPAVANAQPVTTAFVESDAKAKAAMGALEAHCQTTIGQERIDTVAPNIHVARGFDLANTILIETKAGHVVVDAGMSPQRSARTKKALLTKFPGPIAAVVYTHSHIDHVGGASVWADASTPVYATDRFTEHFFKQYDALLRAEKARGQRQFGRDVSLADLPCSGIGRRPDIDAALEIGAVLPTKTFTGSMTLEIGGVEIELVEAWGETDDQLFVWVPQQRALLCGDNFYAAYPNLYTIRGTRPRPTAQWIESLDAMRAKAPEILVPSHTGPITGAAKIARALTVYRDGIQWVRDQVIRGANAGLPIDDVVKAAAVPPHLAKEPVLNEMYGQVSWSARAIYGNTLGWFDGRAQHLYPLGDDERAAHYIALMGGREAVFAKAKNASDPRLAIELLGHLERAFVSPDLRAEAPDDDEKKAINLALASAYERLAAQVKNPNGRAYLLQSANERRGKIAPSPPLSPSRVFEESMPIRTLLQTMATRLKPEETMDVHESVRFRIDAVDATLTVRRGVAELVYGPPLPNTPKPVAVAKTTAATWRKLALQKITGARALLSGDLEVSGDPVAFATFMGRFDRDLIRGPSVLP